MSGRLGNQLVKWGLTSSRQELQTGRGFERAQAMQQHIACAMDTRIQTVAAAPAVATVAGITREGVKSWLCRWDMLGPNG